MIEEQTAHAQSANQLFAELGYLTEQEVAVARDITLASLRNERSRRVGPPFTVVGRKVLYPKKDFLAFLERSTIRPAADAVMLGRVAV